MIEEFASSVGDAVKTVPELYDDALKPAAKESGKLLGRIPRAINAALAPLDIWILNKEHAVEETKKLLAKKLENIEEDKIVPPESYVAVPAIQAISYSMNSSELRDMYANLLANSMNSDNKDSVHPAFVEVIKQLTPFEANLIKLFNEKNATLFPIVNSRICESKSAPSGTPYINNIIDPEFGINTSNFNEFSIAIENLIRLNLISVSYEQYFTNEEKYSSIKNSPLVKDMKAVIESGDNPKYCELSNGLLEITSFGSSFMKICVSK